jgi:hypothetical protein
VAFPELFTARGFARLYGVDIVWGGHGLGECFTIYFTRDKRLPLNEAIMTLTLETVTWHGDIVIVRRSAVNGRIIHASRKAGEDHLLDSIVESSVLTLIGMSILLTS